MIEAIARCRPDAQSDPWAQSVLTAAKMLAQRVQFLETQAETLQAQIDAFVADANPGLRAAYGVGSDTAAQLLITARANPHRLHSEAAFAALCGVAPVPASSGKTNRHRLCRGGDRAANNALFRIALVRMSHHQPTKSYVQRQSALGPHPDGDPAQAQTGRCPRNLQTADPTDRCARVQRPAPPTCN
jgi:transposase